MAALSIAYPAKANLITKRRRLKADLLCGRSQFGPVDLSGNLPHSGNSGGVLSGAHSGSDQPKTWTTPGTSYVARFLVGTSISANVGIDPTCRVDVLWGRDIFSQNRPAPSSRYTEHTFTVTASSAT